MKEVTICILVQAHVERDAKAWGVANKAAAVVTKFLEKEGTLQSFRTAHPLVVHTDLIETIGVLTR